MEKQRLDWADLAKAAAVVLVVLYHVAGNGMRMLTPGDNRAEVVYATFSNWLLPVRMPLFFMVSGLLAVGALQRPWARVLRPKVASHFWTFAFWTLLFAIPYTMAYAPSTFEVTAPRAFSWVLSLGGAYWYLPLLALFFMVTKATRRAGLILVLAAVAAYVLWPLIPLPTQQGDLASGIGFDAVFTLRRFLTFLVWFAAGALLRPLVEKWARIPWLTAVLAVPLYVLGAMEIYGGQRSPWMEIITPALSILGITIALVTCRIAVRWPPMRRLGRYLAARTLPIYVFHPILLALLIWLTPGLGKQGSIVSIWLVPLLVVLLTWASCALYDVLEPRLPWLFGLPGGNPKRYSGPLGVGIRRRGPHRVETAQPQEES